MQEKWGKLGKNDNLLLIYSIKLDRQGRMVAQKALEKSEAVKADFDNYP